MSGTSETEIVPTPFGDGIITQTSAGWSVAFSGPMARDAMEWALEAGEIQRVVHAEVMDIAGARA